MQIYSKWPPRHLQHTLMMPSIISSSIFEAKLGVVFDDRYSTFRPHQFWVSSTEELPAFVNIFSLLGRIFGIIVTSLRHELTQNRLQLLLSQNKKRGFGGRIDLHSSEGPLSHKTCDWTPTGDCVCIHSRHAEKGYLAPSAARPRPDVQHGTAATNTRTRCLNQSSFHRLRTRCLLL